MINKEKYTKKQLKEINDSIGVIIDDREKQPFYIIEWCNAHKIPNKIQRVKYGDYSFYIPENELLEIDGDIDFDEEIVFERKNSIDEIIGNFVERDRIEREFANKGNIEMYLIIEGQYDEIVQGKYRSDYAPKSAIGTFHTFVDRYNLKPIFISEHKFTPVFMFNTFYYHLRNKLK